MLSMIKNLTMLKKGSDAFKIGDYEPISVSNYADNYNVFAFSRSYSDETYKVFINMSNQVTPLSGVTGRIALSVKGATLTSLSPWSILVVGNQTSSNFTKSSKLMIESVVTTFLGSIKSKVEKGGKRKLTI